MGSIFSFVRKPKKILILGPASSGKTTILGHIASMYQLKPKVNPTKHFNFLRCKGFNIWDLPADSNALRIWRYYYDNTACVIFSYDMENPQQSDCLLREICSSKELRHAILLIALNQPMPAASSYLMYRARRILKNRKFRFTVFSRELGCIELKQSFEWIVKNA